MDKYIQVYSDEGVCHFSLFCLMRSLKKLNLKSKLITSNEVIESDWEKETSIFIMPGGRDLLYLKKLQNEGNNKIKEFVEKGGSYLGICAGAYYGSSYVEFDKQGDLEVLGERYLKFFSKKAIGPVFNEPKFVYDTHKGAVAALISYHSITLSDKSYVYFNGGCYFENDEESRIMGNYLELGLNAIVFNNVKKGKSILTGVHLEYAYEDIKNLDDELSKKLVLTENNREKIFEDIIYILIS